MKHILLSLAALALCLSLQAQKYKGVVDKTIAVVGGETILISDVEAEIQQLRLSGLDKILRHGRHCLLFHGRPLRGCTREGSGGSDGPKG